MHIFAGPYQFEPGVAGRQRCAHVQEVQLRHVELDAVAGPARRDHIVLGIGSSVGRRSDAIQAVASVSTECLRPATCLSPATWHLPILQHVCTHLIGWKRLVGAVEARLCHDLHEEIIITGFEVHARSPRAVFDAPEEVWYAGPPPSNNGCIGIRVALSPDALLIGVAQEKPSLISLTLHQTRQLSCPLIIYHIEE